MKKIPQLALDFFQKSLILMKAIFRRSLLILFLSKGCALCAEENDAAENKVRMANQLFAAGDYPKAEQAYALIAELPMKPWQREIVEYNRGTAYLAQKKWREALALFEQINPAKTSSPLLARDLKTNLALTRLFLGIDFLHSEKGYENLQNEDRFLAALYNLRGAIRTADAGMLADCTLQKLEGAAACQPSDDLGMIEREGRLHLAQALVKNRQFQLQHASQEREIPLLLSGLNGTVQDLAFLLENPLSPYQQKKYQDFFVLQAKSWIPLWEALAKDLPDSSQTLFQKAYQSFKEGLSDMQKNAFSESQTQFAHSQERLKELLQQVWGKNPLSILLENLYQDYQTVAMQDPLPLLGLSGLLEEQKQLKGRIEPEQSQRFQRSIERLEKSLESLQKGKPILAKLYFAEAEQEVKSFLLLLQPNRPESLEEILKEGIDKQRFALKLNRLRQDIPQADQQEVIELIHLRQSLVPLTGPQFLEQAITSQKEQFAKGVRKEGQEKQWKEILALVSEGYKKSIQAEKILQTALNAEKGVALQEQVVEAWFKALDKLKNMQNAKNQSEKPTPAAPSPSQAAPSEEKREIKQIFQVAQEMEKNDRSLKQALLPIKQGERPW